MHVSSEALISEVGIPLATFVLCFLSAVVPLIHAELYLITVSALSPPELLPALAVLGAVGQILGKCLVYLGGRGFLRISSRIEAAAARHKHKIEKWKHGDAALIFVSSFTGFPPFMFVSALAGMFRIRFRTFFAFGFLGRLGRFTLALAFPQLIKSLL
jgi:membrane protein YqaA with SNARE-associated domain